MFDAVLVTNGEHKSFGESKKSTNSQKFGILGFYFWNSNAVIKEVGMKNHSTCFGNWVPEALFPKLFQITPEKRDCLFPGSFSCLLVIARSGVVVKAVIYPRVIDHFVFLITGF